MEEKDLIKKAQNGDREAFGKLYKTYFKKIYRYCSFNTKDDELAKDICQETFVKAWKKIKDFKMQENWSIQAFLFTIARNLIIDHSRKRKEFNIEKFEDNIESKEDLFASVDKKENVQKIKIALSNLEEIEKQIIILRYFEEMDTKEVAKIVGSKDGAIRVRIHRILEKLKIIMENEYGKRN